MFTTLWKKAQRSGIACFLYLFYSLCEVSAVSACLAGRALVVPGYQVVRVVHRGGVHRKPVQQAQWGTFHAKKLNSPNRCLN
jgi:hypothetical protein